MLIAIAALIILIAGFEIWWTAAYFHAYRQLRERLLLFPALQGLAMTLLFAFFAVLIFSPDTAASTAGRLLLFLIIGLLIFSLWTNWTWRSRAGARLLAQRYPRGLYDVMLFRRPAADLKRRVRSK